MESRNRGPIRSTLIARGRGGIMWLANASYLRSTSILFMNNPHRLRISCTAGLLACWALCLSPIYALADRAVVSLDGEWQIAEGNMGSVPAQFEHRVPDRKSTRLNSSHLRIS